jgi:preprotein translocase subunit SecA
MLNQLLTRVFGSRNQRVIKRFGHLVRQVAELEARVSALSDAELAAQTQRFRERLAAGETLDQLQPEAFAVVREAGRRVLNMRRAGGRRCRSPRRQDCRNEDR